MDIKTANQAIQHLMSDEEYVKKFKEITEVEYEGLKKNKQEHAPAYLHVFTRTNFNNPFIHSLVAFSNIPAIGDKELSRYDLFRQLGRNFYEENSSQKSKDNGKAFGMLCAVIMTVEVWERDDLDNPAIKNVDWSTLPDSREALVVMGVALGNRNSLARIKFTRDEQNMMIPQTPEYMSLAVRDGTESHLINCFYEGYMSAFKRGMNGL